MTRFPIGCQTYTWEMLGSQWQGSPEQILDAIAAAGYAGVEFSNQMIGAYLTQPAKFGEELARRGLSCAALAYARAGFTNPAQEVEDITGGEAALRFAAHFGVPLCLGGPSSPDRSRRDAKMAQALHIYAELAHRAQDLGVTLAVHPHSHHTSLVTTAAEYDALLESVAPLGIGFNPDTGHMLRGGQDLMVCLQRHCALIRHVHIKDVDAAGEWAPLGAGITPLAELLHWLEGTGYSGWVVIEEESDRARSDPSSAIQANRRVLRSLGF